MDEPVRLLLDDAVARGLCSAAALAIGDGGREVVVHAVGTTRTVPTPGDPIDAGVWFDLASVTKPMATAAIAMALVSRRRLELDAADARGVTPRHLLGHAAGFPAHVKFFEQIWAEAPADPRARLVELASTTPLDRAPGEATVYSDLGYITLGAVLERAGGAPLEQLFADLVAGPLGLAHARYVPLAQPWRPSPVVSTELDARRGLVTGEVHDENAHAGGGVAGHAGLFATLGDVSRFGAAMVALLRGEDQGGIDAAVAIRFATMSAAPDTSWRLGWDTPSSTPGVSHAGERWPRHGTIGHLGYTGTSLWLDPERGRWVALLTNRVHPSREGERAAAIKELRRSVMDAAVAQLG